MSHTAVEDHGKRAEDTWQVIAHGGRFLLLFYTNEKSKQGN